MVLAEKYNYLEDQISEQYPLQNRPKTTKRPKVVQSPAAKSKAKPAYRTGSKIVSVMLLAICFATASLVIFRYAAIAQNHDEIMSLNQSLEKEYAKRENLEVDLAFIEDLSNIEASAEKTLGMSYPKENQVVYVDLPEVNDQKDSQIVEKPEKSFWSKILGFLE